MPEAGGDHALNGVLGLYERVDGVRDAVALAAELLDQFGACSGQTARPLGEAGENGANCVGAEARVEEVSNAGDDGEILLGVVAVPGDITVRREQALLLVVAQQAR